MASIYERQGQLAEALAELTKGREIMAALVAVAPGKVQWKKDSARFEGQISRLQAQVQVR